MTIRKLANPLLRRSMLRKQRQMEQDFGRIRKRGKQGQELGQKLEEALEKAVDDQGPGAYRDQTASTSVSDSMSDLLSGSASDVGDDAVDTAASAVPAVFPRSAFASPASTSVFALVLESPESSLRGKKPNALSRGEPREGVVVDRFEGIEGVELSGQRKRPAKATSAKPASHAKLRRKKRRVKHRRSGSGRGSRMKGSGTRTAKPPKNPKHTDLANSELFLEHHGQDVRYSREWGKWLAWDQTRWVICPDQSDPTERAGETMKRAETLARNSLEKHDLDWAISSQSKARLSAMTSLASTSSKVVVETNALDSDPWILNVENGMLDLHAGTHWKKQKARPYKHIRETLCTKTVSVRYNEYAKCPLWDAFLYRAMDGNEDMVDFLRRLAGYSLTGMTSEQALYFFYGEGANGKSTFLSVLRRLLGEYAIPAPRGLLEAEHNDDHATRLAALYRVRLVIGSEVEAGKHLAESMVKDLTGGEQIAARRMREDFWYFEPTHKIIMQGNHKPTIVGQDEGIWRRIKVVPWKVCIPKEERDPDLVEKLMVELPGILRWAVEGCLAWQTDGMGLRSDLLEDAVREYRTEQNHLQNMDRILQAFWNDNLNYHSGWREPRSDIVNAHKEWCATNKFPVASEKDLAKFLRTNGVVDGGTVRRDGKHVDAWRNVKLKRGDPDLDS